MSDTNSDALEPLADDLLWGAAAIGSEIGVNPRKAFYLLETAAIPAKKCGGLWVGSRRAIREALTGEAS